MSHVISRYAKREDLPLRSPFDAADEARRCKHHEEIELAWDAVRKQLLASATENSNLSRSLTMCLSLSAVLNFIV
jgi:hypothetical protein